MTAAHSILSGGKPRQRRARCSSVAAAGVVGRMAIQMARAAGAKTNHRHRHPAPKHQNRATTPVPTMLLDYRAPDLATQILD